MSVKIDIPMPRTCNSCLLSDGVRCAITGKKWEWDWGLKRRSDCPLRESEERPSGKWIWWTDDKKDYVKCSECDYGEEGEVKLDEQTPYCPYCGSHNPTTDIRR